MSASAQEPAIGVGRGTKLHGFDVIPEADIAEQMDVSVRSLWELRRRRQIPYVRLFGRIFYRRQALEKFFALQEVKPLLPRPARIRTARRKGTR